MLSSRRLITLAIVTEGIRIVAGTALHGLESVGIRPVSSIVGLTVGSEAWAVGTGSINGWIGVRLQRSRAWRRCGPRRAGRLGSRPNVTEEGPSTTADIGPSSEAPIMMAPATVEARHLSGLQ